MNANNSSQVTRRGVIATLLAGLFLPANLLKATSPSPKFQKVKWIKLDNEPVGTGDFWASYDPNTPERQGGKPIGDEPIYFRYNLQMQPVHNVYYGVPANKIGISNGAFWRPVGLVLSNLE